MKKAKLNAADKKLLNGRTISQAARDAGLSVGLVNSRRTSGWSLEKALTTPVQKRTKKPAVKKKAAKKKKEEFIDLPKITNPLASDSAVPGFTDPMDEHLTLASTSQRTLKGDGPLVDPHKDTSWIWLVLIIGALALGSYGLLKGIAGV